MKIYLITKCSIAYGTGHHVCAATTDLETAYRLKKIYSTQGKDETVIEIYDDTNINKGLTLYDCYFDVAQNTYRISLCEYPNGQKIGMLYCNENDDYYSLTDYAENENHIKQLLNNKIAEHKKNLKENEINGGKQC